MTRRPSRLRASRRLRRLPALAAVVGAIALVLTACAPGGGSSTVEADVSAALERSDLGLADVLVQVEKTGFGDDLAITVSIDGDTVSADLLRGILQTTVDAIDPDGIRNLSLHVYRGPQSDGAGLDVLTPAGELGFDTGSPNRPRTSFEQLMSTVVDVLTT